MSDMRRRKFITLLCGAAVAWPLAARAQQAAQLRRVGMLIGYSENDPETQARLSVFRQGLEHLGWKEGVSVRIDYRFAPASPDQAQVLAKELIALRPDVRSGVGTSSVIWPVAIGTHRPTRLCRTGTILSTCFNFLTQRGSAPCKPISKPSGPR
jgi:hypothetical protein